MSTSTASKVTKTWVKQFIALATGNDEEADAQLAKRQALAGLKAQIATMEGEEINKEQLVTDASEKLEKAKLNYGKPITNRTDYVSHLIKCKNTLTEAEESLMNHRETLEFLRAIERSI